MTTTVHDKNAQKITSDSRWSCNISDDEVLYVDTSKFEKMVEKKNFALVMAGDAILISEWKNWAKNIGSERPGVVRIDSLGKENPISICVIYKPSTVLFDVDVATEVTPHARFSGSGRHFAKKCWELNSCALKAISTATENDVYTGGEVKYVELATIDNNLSSDTMTTDELHQLMKTEGYIMNTKTKIETKINKYKNEKDVAKGIDKGELVASAPTGSDKSPWNKSQESALDEAVTVLRTLTS